MGCGNAAGGTVIATQTSTNDLISGKWSKTIEKQNKKVSTPIPDIMLLF